jgi:hypothetical protein
VKLPRFEVHTDPDQVESFYLGIPINWNVLPLSIQKETLTPTSSCVHLQSTTFTQFTMAQQGHPGYGTSPSLKWDMAPHTFTIDDNLPKLMNSEICGSVNAQSPLKDLGDLERLPTETTQAILANLDLDTLETFQHLSRRSGELVRSLP